MTCSFSRGYQQKSPEIPGTNTASLFWRGQNHFDTQTTLHNATDANDPFFFYTLESIGESSSATQQLTVEVIPIIHFPVVHRNPKNGYWKYIDIYIYLYRYVKFLPLGRFLLVKRHKFYTLGRSRYIKTTLM